MSADLQQSILNSDLIYLLTRDQVNPELISDTAENNSDKTLTVPANQIWEILSIYISFTTTANAGIRYILINFRDNSNNIFFSAKPDINHIESLTRFYMFSPNLPRETSFFSVDRLYHPIPKLLIPASYNIRIYDVATIDPTADDMIVHMMVNRFDV